MIRCDRVFFLAAAGMLLGSVAFAAQDGRPVEKRRVLRDQTTLVALELDSKTVFCTERGYGTVQLKVSVPDLDWLAHFDHRVVGETLPCITGGACTGLDRLVDPQERFAIAPMRVILSETLLVDREKQSCQRQLVENIESSIRGRKFTHHRSGDWENVNLDLCLKQLQLG